MKRPIQLCVGLAILSGLFAPSVHAEDAVRDLAKQWMDTYNAHNRNGLGALYALNASLMMHGQPTIKGRKDIEAFWAEDFKVGEPQTALTVTDSVTGVDMVLVHGNYKVTDRKTGKELGSGRFAHIWTKDGKGAWLLDRDLWNQPVASPR